MEGSVPDPGRRPSARKLQLSSPKEVIVADHTLRTGGLAELGEHDRTLLREPLKKLAGVSRELAETLDDFMDYEGFDERAAS